jgi:hypothetical protein
VLLPSRLLLPQIGGPLVAFGLCLLSLDASITLVRPLPKQPRNEQIYCTHAAIVPRSITWGGQHNQQPPPPRRSRRRDARGAEAETLVGGAARRRAVSAQQQHRRPAAAAGSSPCGWCLVRGGWWLVVRWHDWAAAAAAEVRIETRGKKLLPIGYATMKGPEWSASLQWEGRTQQLTARFMWFAGGAIDYYSSKRVAPPPSEEPAPSRTVRVMRSASRVRREGGSRASRA